jgi:hypothetical protein
MIQKKLHQGLSVVSPLCLFATSIIGRTTDEIKTDMAVCSNAPSSPQSYSDQNFPSLRVGNESVIIHEQPIGGPRAQKMSDIFGYNLSVLGFRPMFQPRPNFRIV